MVIPELDGRFTAVHHGEIEQREFGEGKLLQGLVLAGQIYLQLQIGVAGPLAGRGRVPHGLRGIGAVGDDFHADAFGAHGDFLPIFSRTAIRCIRPPSCTESTPSGVFWPAPGGLRKSSSIEAADARWNVNRKGPK